MTIAPAGVTRAGIVELVGHDPYLCDTDCCATHESERCSLCGADFGDGGAPIVAYVLGCEVADVDCGCYRFAKSDRWACYCLACDDLAMEHH